MDTIIPSPSPGIILTDSYAVVQAYNKALEEDPNLLITDLALILQAKFDNSVLYLTNSDSAFISMEYQFMPNTPPKLSLELIETDEFFETKLLRSAVNAVVTQLNRDSLPDDYIEPNSNFYIAFGLGSETSYWSSFQSFSLAGAETFQDFGQAKKMTLTFVAGLGLYEFSLSNLQSFIDPNVFNTGFIYVIEKFILKDVDKLDDQFRVKPYRREREYTKARREFRINNYAFYHATLDNLIDKTLQVIFNTDNVLLLTPVEGISKFVTTNLISQYTLVSDATLDLDDTDRVKDNTVLNLDEAYRNFRKLPPEEIRGEGFGELFYTIGMETRAIVKDIGDPIVEAAQDKVAMLKDQYARAGNSLTEMARNGALSVLKGAGEVRNDLVKLGQDIVDEATDRIENLGVGGALDSVIDDLKEVGGGIIDKSAELVGNAKESFDEIYEKVRQKIEDQTKDTIEDVWSFVLSDFFNIFNCNLCITYIRGNKFNPTLGISENKPDFNSFSRNLDNLGITLNSSKSDVAEIETILKGFIDGYKQITASEDFYLIRETDTSLLQEIDSAFRNKFNKSFFDPKKPLVIFGSKELISQYCYGIDYKDTKQNLLTINTDNIKKLVSKKLDKIFNLYNSQNVNNTILENFIAQDSARRRAFNDIVQKLNYPVFKYNMQNSNVISVTVNDNKAYFNLLNQAYRTVKDYASLKTTYFQDPELLVQSLEEKALEELKLKEDQELESRKAIDDLFYIKKESQFSPISDYDNMKTRSELEAKFNKLKAQVFARRLYEASTEDRIDLLLSLENDYTYSNIQDLIYNYLREDRGNVEAVYKDLFKSKRQPGEGERERFVTKALDEDKLKENAKALLTYMRSEYGLIEKMEDAYADDPTKFFLDKMSVMEQAVYQVEVETLPYFPISTPLFLHIPCLLFAFRPNKLGVNTITNNIDNISGSYYIAGYYHRIDDQRAFSRFKLIRTRGI